ncbi:intradiol ring-cleavage dioxygenase [Thermoleptolyngbya sp. C42_A2020_037]|uniref:intradiol ring-cleavage dioxygenase n=1 Tax=Thermoleptolyngbya sp. C42_A2020_037 TaxID=2747799 RepID=UPI0025DF0533|nr:intradiol ring-cleavage dioxygenase [Thermoleptolyngbya sp. C42_A2020_037]
MTEPVSKRTSVMNHLRSPAISRSPVGRLARSRREVLGFLGGVAGTALFGCSRQPEGLPPVASSGSAQADDLLDCIVRPQQTAGPFFVDTQLNRADLRADPATGRISSGVPLGLSFQIFQVGNIQPEGPRMCMPLPNAVVDVWHCDAAGIYSGVRDRQSDTTGQAFLRGYQVTDQDGVAEFMTIYPGWYPGRTVHIHFKIRTVSTSGAIAPIRYEFTSQLYFDDALTDRIYRQMPYTARGQRAQRNHQDAIFQFGGAQLLLPVAQTDRGYFGRFGIGLEMG